MFFPTKKNKNSVQEMFDLMKGIFNSNDLFSLKLSSTLGAHYKKEIDITYSVILNDDESKSGLSTETRLPKRVSHKSQIQRSS